MPNGKCGLEHLTERVVLKAHRRKWLLTLNQESSSEHLTEKVALNTYEKNGPSYLIEKVVMNA